MLAMFGDRVLVAPENQAETERESGIVTIEAYAPEVMGTIVAVGDVRDVQLGDVVIFPPSAGLEVEWEGQHYLSLREDELLAIVEMTHE